MTICARMLTATAVLFLPAAATACPTGWTTSNASATCFLVPPERSTSLFRCVDLCEEHGGTPASLHRLGGGERLRDGRARCGGWPVARALPNRDGAASLDGQGLGPLRGG